MTCAHLSTSPVDLSRQLSRSIPVISLALANTNPIPSAWPLPFSNASLAFSKEAQVVWLSASAGRPLSARRGIFVHRWYFSFQTVFHSTQCRSFFSSAGMLSQIGGVGIQIAPSRLVFSHQGVTPLSVPITHESPTLHTRHNSGDGSMPSTQVAIRPRLPAWPDDK